MLPNVTLICVATNDYEGGVNALVKSSQSIKWGDIKLITSSSKLDAIENLLMWGIKTIDIEPFKTIDDWNKFIFYNLYQYIDTDFCMLVHPDGYVINPEEWSDEFLKYDYIGAPWPAGCHFDTQGNEVRVGNSVSIRSKRILELPSQWNLPWEEYNGTYNEDTLLCVRWRESFKGQGITYAPVNIAAKFAHEIPVPETEGLKPFAFHSWKPALPKYPPFKLDDCYAAYVNLDSRPDRLHHIQEELDRIGLPAVRQRGYLPDEVKEIEDITKLDVMLNRTPGAVGCYYSQLQVMRDALAKNKHAFVMEDDLIWCDDMKERWSIIEDFLSNHEWDVFWLGGTYHIEPTWHKNKNGVHTHPDLQMCNCTLNKDWEATDNSHIVRTYGCWGTYAYIVNKDRLNHVIDSLDQNMYRSMGIDWSFILLQPNLHTYAFNPGCVIQKDNQSNIGTGITKFSVFATLGNHWYKQKL